MNPHYIFFLLQVTEAVNLKRAETTAFRKASRLKKYTSTFIQDIDKAVLQRTNQGYKTFKSMRGTSPYFEHQKNRLFAMIRYLTSELSKSKLPQPISQPYTTFLIVRSHKPTT